MPLRRDRESTDTRLEDGLDAHLVTGAQSWGEPLFTRAGHSRGSLFSVNRPSDSLTFVRVRPLARCHPVARGICASHAHRSPTFLWPAGCRSNKINLSRQGTPGPPPRARISAARLNEGGLGILTKISEFPYCVTASSPAILAHHKRPVSGNHFVQKIASPNKVCYSTQHDERGRWPQWAGRLLTIPRRSS